VSRGPAVRAALFATQFVVVDVVLHARHGRVELPSGLELMGIAASLALWGLLFSFRTHRLARGSIAVVAALLLVVDGCVFRYYGTPLDRQLIAAAAHGWGDVRPVVVRLLPRVLGIAALVALLEYAWLSSAGSVASMRERAALLGVAVLGFALCPAKQLTPDLRVVEAATLLFTPRLVATNGRVDVPVLPSLLAEPPSVLVVLTESVRASSYCSDPGVACEFSPEVNALFPDRIPLRQMRSLASYTALSVSALLTGKTQQGPRDEINRSPTLFDYVHAIRAGDRPVSIAYWSAQREAVLDRDVRGAVGSLVTLETLLGRAVDDEDDVIDDDMDRQLADRCVAELPKMSPPSLIVLHLLGSHAFYFVDPEHAPFQPFDHVVSWGTLPSLKNAYQNAIFSQDRNLARCLKAFLRHEGTHPWMVIFTSDHGEAFGEHGGIHHGNSLYDEQTHVPGFIVTSPNALTKEQKANLALYEDRTVTHLDVIPTVLDALGVWDTLPMAPLHARLLGRSLLAPAATLPALPMTNCTAIFPCPLNTWGMLGEGHALIAQPWDWDWVCVNLRTGQEHVSGASCKELREASRSYFPLLPGGQRNDINAQ
jgi:hypothetical protein